MLMAERGLLTAPNIVTGTGFTIQGATPLINAADLLPPSKA